MNDEEMKQIKGFIDSAVGSVREGLAEELKPIREDIREIKGDVNELKVRMDSVETGLQILKTDVRNIRKLKKGRRRAPESCHWPRKTHNSLGG